MKNRLMMITLLGLSNHALAEGHHKVTVNDLDGTLISDRFILTEERDDEDIQAENSKAQFTNGNKQDVSRVFSSSNSSISVGMVLWEMSSRVETDKVTFFSNKAIFGNQTMQIGGKEEQIFRVRQLEQKFISQLNAWHFATLATMDKDNEVTINVQSLHQGDVDNSFTPEGDISIESNSCESLPVKPFEMCTLVIKGVDSGTQGKVFLDNEQFITVNGYNNEASGFATTSQDDRIPREVNRISNQIDTFIAKKAPIEANRLSNQIDTFLKTKLPREADRIESQLKNQKVEREMNRALKKLFSRLN